MNFIQSITNWTFLQEPLYRWAIFVIAMAFISFGWQAILGFMR
jgi:hypothetical protein